MSSLTLSSILLSTVSDWCKAIIISSVSPGADGLVMRDLGITFLLTAISNEPRAESADITADHCKWYTAHPNTTLVSHTYHKRQSKNTNKHILQIILSYYTLCLKTEMPRPKHARHIAG